MSHFPFIGHVSKTVAIGAQKLQKESEKAKDKEQRKKEKKEKKEKRRELKERKKGKKEKEKKEKAHQNLDKSGIVNGHVGEKLQVDTKAGLLHKQCEAESEHVERSGVTEEHEPPVCSHAPSSSSDSTENSNKRKRECSATDENRVHGKVIRIRLSKKQNDLNALVNQKQTCPNPGTTTLEGKNDIGVVHRREGACVAKNGTSEISRGPSFGRGGEQIPSSSLGQKAVNTTRKIGTSGTPPLGQKAVIATRKTGTSGTPPLGQKAVIAAREIGTSGTPSLGQKAVIATREIGTSGTPPLGQKSVIGTRKISTSGTPPFGQKAVIATREIATSGTPPLGQKAVVGTREAATSGTTPPLGQKAVVATSKTGASGTPPLAQKAVIATRETGTSGTPPLAPKAVIATREIGTSGTPPLAPKAVIATRSTPTTRTAVASPMQKVELQYKNLFENWIPPQTQDTDPCDMDWLFQGKSKVGRSEARQISGSESSVSCSSDQALWPYARHLPEVDVYALPFTVPF